MRQRSGTLMWMNTAISDMVRLRQNLKQPGETFNG